MSNDHSYEEYSAAALVHLDNVQFIDGPVVGSSITSSDPANMPLRQTGHLQYNFTEQETKYLLNDNTCVIDNLVGLYGKELKLNRNKIIKLNHVKQNLFIFAVMQLKLSTANVDKCTNCFLSTDFV